MTTEESMLEAGTLWELTQQVTRAALESGHLLHLETRVEIVQDGGIPFIIRVLSSRLRKDQNAVLVAKTPGPRPNPFLPHDPRLFVAELSGTHVCLLNKFNVVEHHILMVTREFEEQEAPLTREDLETVAICLREFEGLAFYNSGTTAGASQPHKHLQYVPLAEPGRGETDVLLVEASAQPGRPPHTAQQGPQPGRLFHGKVPIEMAIPEGPSCGIVRSEVLPFRHWFRRFPCLDFDDLDRVTSELHSGYSGLCANLTENATPYNLLVTRNWMMMAPRSQESFRSISVNALGYAGSLLVKNEEEMEWIREAGPMEVLRACGVE